MKKIELNEDLLKQKKSKSKVRKLGIQTLGFLFLTLTSLIFTGNYIYSIFTESATLIDFIAVFFLVILSLVSFIMTFFRSFEYSCTDVQYRVKYEGYVRKGKFV